MAQKKRSTRKSRSRILPFTKKIDHQIRHLAGAFENNFDAGGGGNLKEPLFKSLNPQGIMLKLRLDRRLIQSRESERLFLLYKNVTVCIH